MRRSTILKRFTGSHPCPICGGHDTLGRGRGVRCFGYYLGKAARCTREEYAGSLPQNGDGTYSHRLRGRCDCGQRHGRASSSAGSDHTAAPSTLRPRAEQRFRSFFTLEAFLRRRYGDGAALRHWVYRDASGGESFRVLRIDYRAPDGTTAKSYRPCHQGADGRWRLSRPEGLLPLYNLPSILAAPRDATVAVFEGEKCTDLATSLGLPYATTSAHGAKAPQLTDWSPLVGRTVALLGDADADGMLYMAKIAMHLAALESPARFRIVCLPGLAEGQDIEQWIAHRRESGTAHAGILAELLTLIAPSC